MGTASIILIPIFFLSLVVIRWFILSYSNMNRVKVNHRHKKENKYMEQKLNFVDIALLETIWSVGINIIAVPLSI